MLGGGDAVRCCEPVPPTRGRIFLSGGSDATVRVWDIKTQTLMASVHVGCPRGGCVCGGGPGDCVCGGAWDCVWLGRGTVCVAGSGGDCVCGWGGAASWCSRRGGVGGGSTTAEALRMSAASCAGG